MSLAQETPLSQPADSKSLAGTLYLHTASDNGNAAKGGHRINNDTFKDMLSGTAKTR